MAVQTRAPEELLSGASRPVDLQVQRKPVTGWAIFGGA